MDFYLYPALRDEPVLSGLLSLKDGTAARGVYAPLLRFAAERAFTSCAAREYAVRSMLRHPLTGGNELALPYLRRDAETIYDAFFTPDWDAVCAAAADSLPLPRGCDDNAPGEPDYKRAVSSLVTSDSAGALFERLREFYASYTDESEAMYRAFRWDGALNGIPRHDAITLDDLDGLDAQKTALLENTGAFVRGKPANDVLLAGASGTGKSSCVKAVLNRFAADGLRLAEIPKGALGTLPRLMDTLAGKKRRYIVFIDDLAFENPGESYLELKVALDGQLARRPENVLIYATSNRRRLVRETWRDRQYEEDIHETDARYERLSLSERFGLHLYFPVLSQAEYFSVIAMLLSRAGVDFTDAMRSQAAAWAAEHNGRSGRSAAQYAANVLGRG